LDVLNAGITAGVTLVIGRFGGTRRGRLYLL
jgi:hypothetical protein